MKSPLLIPFLRQIPKVRTYYARYLERWIDNHPDAELNVKIFNGSNMLLTVKDWVQRNLFVMGYYENHESRLWQHLTRNKEVVVDIGANVGYFSLLASPQVDSSGGMIFSFEPITHTYKRAKFNVQLNQYSNIYLFQIAISDQNGKITINVGNESNWGMSSITQHDYLSDRSETVTSQTLDSFVEIKGIKTIDIIKIDIEGSEYRALKGMIHSIAEFRPILLVEVLDENLNKAGSGKEDVFEYFSTMNYNAYKIVDHLTLHQITVPISFAGLICFCPKEKLPKHPVKYK